MARGGVSCVIEDHSTPRVDHEGAAFERSPDGLAAAGWRYEQIQLLPLKPTSEPISIQSHKATTIVEPGEFMRGCTSEGRSRIVGITSTAVSWTCSVNRLHNTFVVSRPPEEESIDALSFKDVASFLGIGEMTAYQDEQKALALLRKTFPTPDTLFSEGLAAPHGALDARASVCLHPRRKNWFPVDRVVCSAMPAPCLTTTAIVFQLLYRRNAQYRPAVFRKLHGCWREIALVRQLVFFEERLLAQLNRPLPASALAVEGTSLGLRIELEEGVDASGPFSLPVPTAFFIATPS